MGSELNLSGRKLAQVALTCRDLERSKAFYQGVLGLTFLFEVSGMLFFQLDGMRLMLGKELKPNSPIGGSVVYFDAPDHRRARPAAGSQGREILRPAANPATYCDARTETARVPRSRRQCAGADGNGAAQDKVIPIPPQLGATIAAGGLA